MELTEARIDATSRATFAFPSALVQTLCDATPEELAEIEVSSPDERHLRHGEVDGGAGRARDQRGEGGGGAGEWGEGGRPRKAG